MADLMGWLNRINQGQPGGPMGMNQMPQPGGMPMQPPMPPAPGAGPQVPMGPGATPRPPIQAPPTGISPDAPEMFGAPATPQPGAGISAQDRAMMDLYTGLADLQPGQEKVSKQRALAEQLRGGAGMPGMRSAGRVQQAANPLEFLSSLAHAGGAAYMGSQADKAAEGLGSQRRDILEKWRTGQGFSPRAKSQEMGPPEPTFLESLRSRFGG